MGSTGIIIAFIVALLIIIITQTSQHSRTSSHIVQGMIINVIADPKHKDDAIRVMLDCNARMLALLDHLRNEYKIDATDTECDAKCLQGFIAQRKLSKRDYAVIWHLLHDFNYEAIREHHPAVWGKNVAYSLNKGKTIMLCLREGEKRDDGSFTVDIDTLMFVILHEAAHVANFDEWGHQARFWSIFKYLLNEAARIGVYTPINYRQAPTRYCGFLINHNPYFDMRIQSFI